MPGLPPALLTKWQTPFDHASARLRTFLPLEPFPNHLTEEKCLELHSIYGDAYDRTVELEGIVASTLKALQRKRSRAVASSSVESGREDTTNAEKDLQTPKKKKKDRRPVPGEGQSAKRRKNGKDDKSSSQRWPAWATRTPKPGDQVAAKVEDEPHWILATVEKHNEKKGVFIVVDDDAGEDTRRHFKLKRASILTLPRLQEASGAIFPVGSRVMTLYPNTTTFYPATISSPFVEGRDGGIDYCVMQFQDDELTPEGSMPHWRLPARFVRQRS